MSNLMLADTMFYMKKAPIRVTSFINALIYLLKILGGFFD